MEKRYQVFVSSTYEDLIKERQEVMNALLELKCIPAGMELFPAADEDQWTLIKQVIDECDYYIVIIAGKYGSEKDGMSYTEREYRYALEKNKPTIAFLHHNPNKLIVSKTDINEEKRKKLEEFRSLVKNKMVKTWKNAPDLGSVVSRSLINLINQHPAIGWVRADKIPDPNLIAENLQLRKKIEELKKELKIALISPPKDTEKYAHGDQTFKIIYNYQGDHKPLKKKLECTWNEIFSIISPSMINECSEKELKLRLNEYISKEAIQKLQKLHKLVYRIQISLESFDKILAQFYALELIKKSLKKHSTTDTNKYWSLTNYGLNSMKKLSAIRNLEFFEGNFPKDEKEVMIHLQHYINKTIPNVKNLFLKTGYIGYEHIRKINIYEEELEELPNSINNLPYLEELSIYNNQPLYYIPPHIKDLTNLKVLTIENADFDNIPEEIYLIKNLEELRIDQNNIKIIPSTIEQLTNMKEFSLWNNYIEVIHDSILKLDKLTKLNIGFGDINDFPEIIFKLLNLKDLSIGGGNFTTIPDSLGNMVNLEYLYIYNKFIETLPKSLTKLKKLKYLALRCENLETLPEFLDELIDLEDIEISFCPIREIPNSILNLKKLKSILYTYYEDNLSEKSKELIKKLEIKGCMINMHNLERFDKKIS